MPPPTAPDDLVGRLNALRAPSTKLEASHAQDDVDAVLARRFEALGGSHHDTPSDGLTRAIADSSTVHSSEDAETVEQLLAELGPEDQWTLDGDEQGEVQRLLDEARHTLPDERSTVDSRPAGGDPAASPVPRDHRASPVPRDHRAGPVPRDHPLGPIGQAPGSTAAMSEEDEAAAEATDEQEADAYVQRVLAELELEERSRPLLPPASSPHPPAASAPEKHTRLGVSPPPDSALDLALPSVPTAPPLTSAREPTAVFSDAEIDSWCIVCSDDAGVKCLGCDGDLYCAACWKEGHVGPDAGMEERGHRWARFTKPATTR